MPPASSVEREEERRLNMRTLTIASAASATAAAVTSQLWIAGTWLAAAVTPVLVAVISEAMHRPTERIARAWTSEREPRSPRAATPTHAEPAEVSGTAGQVRVYRQTTRGVEQTGRGNASRNALSRSTKLSRRRIAIGTVAATAAIAFVVGIVALTTADLVSGGSVGKGSGRTTLLGGRGDGNEAKQDGRKQGSAEQQQQQESPTREQTTTPDEPTTTQPAPAPQPQSDTAPVPPPSQTPPGEPAPQPIP
jgi:hypothetical protein